MKDLCITEVNKLIKHFQDVRKLLFTELSLTLAAQAKAKINDDLVHEYMNPARKFDLGFT
jgi:hypothetical protein